MWYDKEIIVNGFILSYNSIHWKGWRTWILKCFREWTPSSFSLWGLIWRHLEGTASSSQPLYSTGSSVTTPLFYLSSNFPVSYPSIPPCSSFTTPIFYLTPQSPLFYSPLPNLLPQPLLWLCPPHSGPVTAPMESAASGKICKLRRMHQLLAYHGQVVTWRNLSWSKAQLG